MKVLKEKYKTWEGARKRAQFENGVAKSEYQNGHKAHLYRYFAIADKDGIWRVWRERVPATVE